MNSLLTLTTGVVVIAGLYVAREVLVPITLAILLSFVLAPIVEVAHEDAEAAGSKSKAA